MEGLQALAIGCIRCAARGTKRSRRPAEGCRSCAKRVKRSERSRATESPASNVGAARPRCARRATVRGERATPCRSSSACSHTGRTCSGGADGDEYESAGVRALAFAFALSQTHSSVAPTVQNRPIDLTIEMNRPGAIQIN